MHAIKTIGTAFVLIGASTLIASADDDLEKQVNAARSEVIEMTKGATVTDADIEVTLPVAPLLSAVTAMKDAPPERRTISVKSNGANGKFWEDGPTWCNSYVELGSTNGFNANAVLSDFAATVKDGSTLAVSAKGSVAGKVDLHWHVYGPRVPVFGCPYGGGNGGHVGVEAATSFPITANANLVQDGANFLYTITLVDPPKVNMTLEIGLDKIGKLGIPRSFDIPLGVVASGPLPMMVANKGEVTMPDGQKRTYSISLAPKRVTINQSAATGAWTGKVEVMAPGS
jgi:hypothetical protein